MATQSNHCSYCERGTSALCKGSVVGAYYDIASGQVEWLADRIARGLPLGLMRMQRPGRRLGGE